MIKKTALLLVLAAFQFMPLQAADTLAVHQDSLANGLKILVLEKPGLPLVSFQVWYRVGSRNERPGITGISHLLEHMMFKGTAKVGPEEFSRLVQKYGGNCNAFTSEDYTAYYENISTEFLSVAMELEADRMANLGLKKDEFEPERNVVKEERRLRENSPYGHLFEQLSAAAYTAHPYGWPVLGWMSDLDAVGVDDLRAYYRAYYTPDNAACVIVGDISPAEAVAMVGKYFGAIPRGQVRPYRVFTVEPPQLGERRVQVVREARMPIVAMGYHIPALGHQDLYALELLSNILSNGESSRLYRRLVYEKQLALYAGGYCENQSDPGLFIFYAAPQKGKEITEVERALRDELERVKEQGATEQELQKSKNQLEAEYVFQQQRNNGLASQIGSAQTQIGWRHLNSYLKNIRTVSNRQIMDVARKYFTDSNRTVATLVPSGNGAGREVRQ
jgi:zinc protease